MRSRIHRCVGGVGAHRAGALLDAALRLNQDAEAPDGRAPVAAAITLQLHADLLSCTPPLRGAGTLPLPSSLAPPAGAFRALATSPTTAAIAADADGMVLEEPERAAVAAPAVAAVAALRELFSAIVRTEVPLSADQLRHALDAAKPHSALGDASSSLLAAQLRRLGSVAAQRRLLDSVAPATPISAIVAAVTVLNQHRSAANAGEAVGDVEAVVAAVQAAVNRARGMPGAAAVSADTWRTTAELVAAVAATVGDDAPAATVEQVRALSLRLLRMSRSSASVNVIASVFEALSVAAVLRTHEARVTCLITAGHGAEGSRERANEATLATLREAVDDVLQALEEDAHAADERSPALARSHEALRVGMKVFHVAEDHAFVAGVFQRRPALGATWEIARSLTKTDHFDLALQAWSALLHTLSNVPSMIGAIPTHMRQMLRDTCREYGERCTAADIIATCRAAASWPVDNVAPQLVLEWALDGHARHAPLNTDSVAAVLELLHRDHPRAGVTTATVRIAARAMVTADTPRAAALLAAATSRILAQNDGGTRTRLVGEVMLAIVDAAVDAPSRLEMLRAVGAVMAADGGLPVLLVQHLPRRALTLLAAAGDWQLRRVFETAPEAAALRAPWRCAACGTSNGPSRKSCRLCGALDVALWTCKSCGGASSTAFSACQVCASPRPGDASVTPLAPWRCGRCHKPNPPSLSLFCASCNAPTQRARHIKAHVCSTCGHRNQLGALQPWCPKCGSLHPSCSPGKTLWRCSACSTCNPWMLGACRACAELRPADAAEIVWTTVTCPSCGGCCAPWQKRCPHCSADVTSAVQHAVAAAGGREWAMASFESSHPSCGGGGAGAAAAVVADAAASASAGTARCTGCGNVTIPAQHNVAGRCVICYEGYRAAEMWLCARPGCWHVNAAPAQLCERCAAPRGEPMESLLYDNGGDVDRGCGAGKGSSVEVCADESASRTVLLRSGELHGIVRCASCGAGLDPTNVSGWCSHCDCVTCAPCDSEAAATQRQVQLWALLHAVVRALLAPPHVRLEGDDLLRFVWQTVGALQRTAAERVALLPWHGRDILRGGARCEGPWAPVHVGPDDAPHGAILMLRTVIMHCCHEAAVVSPISPHGRLWLRAALAIVDLTNATTQFDEIGFAALAQLCYHVRPHQLRDIQGATRLHYLGNMKLSRARIVNGVCCALCLSATHRADACPLRGVAADPAETAPDGAATCG